MRSPRKACIRGQTRAMAEDQPPSHPVHLPLALVCSLETHWSEAGMWMASQALVSLWGGNGRQAGVWVTGCAWWPGREVPVSPSWAQRLLPGISWLSVECSGGSGWGQLKEALLWTGALSSFGRRKRAVSCPAVWPRQPASPRPRFHPSAGPAVIWVTFF